MEVDLNRVGCDSDKPGLCFALHCLLASSIESVTRERQRKISEKETVFDYFVFCFVFAINKQRGPFFTFFFFLS